MNNNESISSSYPTGTLHAPSTPNNNTCTHALPNASGEPDTSRSSQKRKPKRTEEDKLEYMLGALNELSWTLGDFLYKELNEGEVITE
ncbi:hypothetical protein PHLCEN_2v1314 [Hermanssonia centrifuga]|uniref:Uncharacterized protein n=1 Tax=Hermanssonia centrifuga TaxID=98765 RepID=A0A2R6S3N4_9APHY|nr:hypothetical protein PHLCEN_2v1314 [Hermanssonia centrifuga]